ncbi:MAG: hypothetical protein KJ052_12300 [Candidatus Hydrogenedentes bacterium]|nr:hypothetical protein [Candidatus Hydrogenedentota bacterium]
MNRTKAFGLLILAVAAVFVFGLIQLFRLEFNTGNIYPPYSSLRSDPLGTKVLYESLRQLPALSVSRSVKTIGEAGVTPDTAYVYIGSALEGNALVAIFEEEDEERRSIEAGDFPIDIIDEVEDFVETGGRVIVAFYPVGERRAPRRPPPGTLKEVLADPEEAKEDDDEKVSLEPPEPAAPEPDAGKEKKARKKDKDPANSEDDLAEKLRKNSEDLPGFVLPRYVSLAKRWSAPFEFLNLPKSEAGVFEPVPVRKADGDKDGQEISWHSALYFDVQEDPWTILYTRDGMPVVIERTLGEGTLVLVSDSYPFSNEAMRKERNPGLLVGLFGDKPEIVFDETIHGVVRTPGVVALAYEYRLHGIMATALILALLFVWKNATSIRPPDFEPGTSMADTVSEGHDAASGLVDLLRRGIVPSKVLQTCVQEWRKSQSNKAGAVATVDAMEQCIRLEQEKTVVERDWAGAYNSISGLLKRKVRGTEVKTQQEKSA